SWVSEWVSACCSSVLSWISFISALFFCGPSQRNNGELKEFHDSLWGRADRPVPATKGAAPFMEATGPDLVNEIFGNAEIFHFENPLRFDSPEALYSYWSSYNLYD